jgi:hypothetical protein
MQSELELRHLSYRLIPRTILILTHLVLSSLHSAQAVQGLQTKKMRSGAIKPMDLPTRPAGIELMQFELRLRRLYGHIFALI